MEYASLSRHLPLTTGSSLSLIVMMLPFLSFLLLITFGRGRETWAWLSTGIHLATAVASAIIFTLVWDGETIHARTVWFQLSTTESFRYSFTFGLLIDKVAALIMLVVTIVSFLVHLYSIEYMRGEKHYTRYFAYLGLFTFAMLGVVLMDNLLLIFIFWELVGVSSYALISFWNERPAALQAGSKAFIMNRIGDAGFLVGIMILWSQFGTLDLQVLESLMRQSVLTKEGYWLSNFRIGGQIFENSAPAHWLTIAGIGLFCGSIGKSAQFPLQTWLPDAMQGPTPASALIHAATMVAAGVYLLARVFVLLDGDVLTFIAFTGAITAFMGAVAALTQHDIKKVLAFSTVSQLGYMIMGMGVGAYEAAIFHLVTHAAFKACLFLAAGSVIHALHQMSHHAQQDAPQHGFDAQDMRMMGGFRKKLPYTFAAYLIAALSLAGVPLFSGFLSKDAILAGTLAWTDAIASPQLNFYYIVPTLAFTTTLLTALYMGRQLLLVFWGEFRAVKVSKGIQEVHQHLKESPVLMLIPLGVLSVLSVGFVYSFNPLNGDMSWLTRELATPTLAVPGDFRYLEEIIMLKNNWHTIASALALGLVVSGVGVAFIIYRPNGKFARQYASFDKQNKGIRSISFHNWYLDSIYRLLVITPVIRISGFIHHFDQKVINGLVDFLGVFQVVLAHIVSWFDRYVVDGIVKLITKLAQFIGWLARPAQEGKIQTYFIISLLIFIAFLYWVIL
ncbi:NADH-quinone oxidoreductase subunit L [Catalinimonas niigatensis]|uniref:NADH-quinone oxidoreductase subunit L n=1 Tax=Catalinimonas niigatensis TaxID=1397264 RepID=UPI0026654ECD|nr:NADH-quinone oxidoreductase subunit L [Catalinimonas niigatensis]WPP50621.1 NADH-quinone oxidoreductase subunit L [Catalinimonas niigatensis]